MPALAVEGLRSGVRCWVEEGKERKGKERKGKERKGKERKGKEEEEEVTLIKPRDPHSACGEYHTLHTRTWYGEEATPKIPYLGGHEHPHVPALLTTLPWFVSAS